MRNILFFVHLVACFDPERVEYCKIRCLHNYKVSSGCFCKKISGRQEITDNMVEFRKLVLQVHNRLRNNLARGDEEENNYPPAQDMQVLNYDLELEYLGRCYLTSSRYKEGGIDPCTATTFCTPYPASQNLYEGSTKNTSLEWVEEAVKGWYKEMNNVPLNRRKELMARFKQENASHFTQVIWASMRRLGCTRVWFKKINKFILLCNYAGPKNMCTANIVDLPVYTAGPPCTACEKIDKCNIKFMDGLYEALCGALRPVETQSPKAIGRGAEKGIPKETDENRKLMEKYFREEYEDQVVNDFFGFGNANYKHVDRMVFAILVVKLINL